MSFHAVLFFGDESAQASRLQVTNPKAFRNPCVRAIVGMLIMRVFVARLKA
jgi:hypothetical protein